MSKYENYLIIRFQDFCILFDAYFSQHYCPSGSFFKSYHILYDFGFRKFKNKSPFTILDLVFRFVVEKKDDFYTNQGLF